MLVEKEDDNWSEKPEFSLIEDQVLTCLEEEIQ